MRELIRFPTTCVQEDVIDFLSKQIPKGVWKHDAQDGNGDAHLKAGLGGRRRRSR